MKYFYYILLCVPSICFSQNEIIEEHLNVEKFKTFLSAFEKLYFDLSEYDEDQHLYYLGKSHAYHEILMNLHCSSFYKVHQDQPTLTADKRP